MGTNCVPILVDLFLQLYEARFLEGIHVLRKKKKFIAHFFNFSSRHKDDVLSLNNPSFKGLPTSYQPK